MTAARTTTGKRLIRTSKTLFALLKVINHCGHGGMAPQVLHAVVLSVLASLRVQPYVNISTRACSGIHFCTHVWNSWSERTGWSGVVGGNFGKKIGKKNRQMEERGREARNMRILHPLIHMHALKRTSRAIHHKSPIHTHWAESYSKGELWMEVVEMGGK